MRYVAGIDVGTSGVKCILVGEDGHVAASQTRNYPLSNPKDGWSEQNPADWWEGTCSAMKAAVEQSGAAAGDIAGVSFSGQMHGLVALDESDNVIRPAILWNDQRTEKECEEIIAAAGGLDGLLSHTNNTMLTGYTGGKILWMKKNEPDNYARMKHFLMPKDYIRFLLTGQKCTEVSDASGTGFFDVEKRTFSFELIDLLGFDRAVFPDVLESDELAGHVTKEAAALTGLPEGLAVYAGGGDAVIQTTGMGIVKEGTIGFIIGTSGVVSMALDGFGHNTGGKVQFFCNNDKNKWQAIGCQLSSGGSMEWFKNTFYDGVEDPYKLINEGAEASKPGANGVVFLPYLTGERAPHADPYARGVFFGLSVTSTRGDMARAVMEGVVFGLREIYELILSTKPGMQPTEVVSSGGASKSRVWRQIQADIMGLPVKTLRGAAEGGAYGAAVVAGVGVGIWGSIEEAAQMLTVETVTQPIAENVEKYNSILKTYSGLYQDLKHRFREI
jgi:xylulokinase